MSQVHPFNQSQLLANSQSDETLNYLKDKRNFPHADSDSEPADDCDLEIENDELNDENDDLTKSSYLQKLFTAKTLSKLSQDQLSHLFNTNLNFYFYKNVKKSIKQNDENKTDSFLSEFLNYVELTFDCLIGISSVKFGLFDRLFETSLKIVCVIFEYLKQSNEVSLSQQQQQSSQIMQGLNQSQSDLFKRSNAVILKLSTLIETKSLGLEKAENRLSLTRICYYFSKLASNYLHDAKNLVSLWRVVSKLIKNKFFTEFNDLDSTVLTIKSNNVFACKELTAKSIFLNLYQILYDSLYSHLKIARANLAKLGNNDTTQIAHSQTSISSQVASQLRLSNNLPQDTVKIIRFCSFLFKIFKSMFLGNETLLNETFQSITNILSLISYLLLADYPATFDSLIESNPVVNNKEFQTIKLEFIKEISNNFEQIVQILCANSSYLNYLSNLRVEDFIFKTNVGVEFFEELLVYISILTNKISPNNLTKLNPAKFVDLALSLAALSSSAFQLPTYLIFYQQNDFSKFTELNYADPTSTLYLEFYDFLLVNLSSFSRKVIFQASNENLFFYLTNNFFSTNHQTNLKAKISSDLIISLVRMLQTSSRHNKIVQFWFDVYESWLLNETSSIISLSFYETFLVDLLDILNAKSLCVLEEYFKEKKYFHSYSLGFKQFTKHAEIFIFNSITKINQFFDDLTQFIETYKKEANFQKRLFVFINGKHGFGLIQIVNNLTWTNSTSFKTNLAVINARDQLLKKLYDFFKSDLIESLFGSGNLLKFVLGLVFLWSKISVTLTEPTNEDLIFMLNLMQKNIESSDLIELKLAACYLVKSLSVREVKDAAVVKKCAEVFGVLLADANAIVRNLALECLNEFLQSSQANNKILSELVRHHAKLKDCVGNYLRQIAHVVKNDFEILMERNEMEIERFKKGLEGNFVEEEKLERNEEDLMDETMNAILCAMDTSVVDQNSQTGSATKTRVETENLLSKIESDLNKVLQTYNYENQPSWLRDKLNTLTRLINDSI